MGEQDSKQREVISAMVDGHASDADLDRAMEMLACGSVGRQTWHAYHVVGDVMRGGVSNDVRHDAAFLVRLQGALQQEAANAPVPPRRLPACRLLRQRRCSQVDQARTKNGSVGAGWPVLL